MSGKKGKMVEIKKRHQNKTIHFYLCVCVCVLDQLRGDLISFNK